MSFHRRSSSLRSRAIAVLGVPVLLIGLAGCGSGADAETASKGSEQTGTDSSGAGQTAPMGPQPGASGVIAAVDGQTLQVQSQASGQVAVSYTDTTAITAQVQAALADLAVGDCVRIISTGTDTDTDTGAESRSDTDTVTAASIAITEAVDGVCGAYGPGGGPGGGGPGGAGGDAPTDMPGDMPTDGQGPPQGMGGGFGFGISGEVTAIEDGTVTVAAVQPTMPGADGTESSEGSASSGADATLVQVATTSDTTVTTTQAATAQALVVGQCVSVLGESDTTGAVAATTIRVSDPVDGECSSRGGFGGGMRPSGDSGTQERQS